MESEIEFRSMNKGYSKLNKKINNKFISAWKLGKTGYPLVDASMRCLISTGYVNFRMRALLGIIFNSPSLATMARRG